MSREAMQQALEALMMMRDKCEEYACPEYACPACDHADAAITTLRKALAEPEPDFSGIDRQAVLTALLPDIEKLFGLKYEKDAMAKTLEVTPAQMVHADAVAEPEQEPVAWMQEMPVSGNEERSVRMTTVKMVADEWDNPIPLYTAPTTQPNTDCHAQGICQRSGYSIAPTPRRPLTYDELEPLCEAFDSYDTTQNELVEFARAIERAHGIGEQHE